MNTLLELRKAKGFSQAKLAALVNTTPGQIKHLEKGVRKLTKEWAERLAPYLGVTAQELLFPDDSVDYSGENVPKKKTKSIPILLQITNGEWIKVNDDSNTIETPSLIGQFEPFKAGQEMVAVKIGADLKDALAKKDDLAICFLLKDRLEEELKDSDIVLTKTLFSDTNLAKYSLYKLRLKAGSTEIELDNCFVNAESKKIILDVNDMKDIAIVAKVCYFVRLP